jgi:hypothetical protein
MRRPQRLAARSAEAILEKSNVRAMQAEHGHSPQDRR